MNDIMILLLLWKLLMLLWQSLILWWMWMNEQNTLLDV
jgi:hypothetical protein